MKKYLSILFAVLLAGCATTEQSAYRTIGTITIAVDGAMNGWGDYVRSGQASATQEASVRSAYGQYQNAMRSLKVMVMTWKAQPDGASKLDTALAMTQAASGSLITLIQTLTLKGQTP